MSFIENLLEIGKKQIEAYCKHDFSIQIGNGSLPMDNFKYYIVQDLLYLVLYKKAALEVSSRMPDLECSKYFRELGEIGTEAEIEFIRGIGENIEVKDYNLKTDPANSDYTSFIAKTVQNGSILEGATALFPCNYLYCTCYSKVYEVAVENDSWYQNWTKNYADPEFRKAVELYKKLIDKIAENSSEEEKKKTQKCFITAVEKEIAFVDSIINYKP